MRPVVLSRDQALAHIIGEHFTASPPTQPTNVVVMEYVRAALFVNAIQGALEREFSVYVTRVTNMLMSQLGPLDMENVRRTLADWQHDSRSVGSDPRRFRAILNTLADMGDAHHIGGGYWLPTPVRLVQLPQHDRILVAGTAPTSVLAKFLQTEVSVAGVSRTLSLDRLPETFQNNLAIWQDYNDWLGRPPTDLASWTKAILERHMASMKPSATGYSDFEVYNPISGSPFQYYRWVRFEEAVGDGLELPNRIVLCRSIPNRALWSPRKYWLGLISDGKMIKETPLSNVPLRRLLYGLDLMCDAPTTVWWNGDSLTIHSWLPPEERRLLLALGTEVSDSAGKLPLIYRVEKPWQKQVNDALRRLRVTIRQEATGA